MSQGDSLHNYVLAQFRKAFGPPHTTLGRDYHWGLQSSLDATPINVLLNGTRESAAVWIFDSHDPHDGVTTASITREDEAGDVICRIQERVKGAARPGDPPGTGSAG